MSLKQITFPSFSWGLRLFVEYERPVASSMKWSQSVCSIFTLPSCSQCNCHFLMYQRQAMYPCHHTYHYHAHCVRMSKIPLGVFWCVGRSPALVSRQWSPLVRLCFISPMGPCFERPCLPQSNNNNSHLLSTFWVNFHHAIPLGPHNNPMMQMPSSPHFTEWGNTRPRGWNTSPTVLQWEELKSGFESRSL